MVDFDELSLQASGGGGVPHIWSNTALDLMLNSAEYTSQLGVPPAALAGLGRVTLFRSAWLPGLARAASGLEARRESGVSQTTLSGAPTQTQD